MKPICKLCQQEMTWSEPRLFCQTPGCLNSWDHQVTFERQEDFPGVMSAGSDRGEIGKERYETSDSAA